MARVSFRILLAAGPMLAGACVLAQAQNTPAPDAAKAAPELNLTEYRTVDTAVTTQVSAATPSADGVTGFLGVAVGGQGRVLVEEVQSDSPADKAGLKKGDVITRVGDRPVASPQAFREWLQTYSAGAPLKLHLERQGTALDVATTLSATSRPKNLQDAPKGGKGGKGGGGQAALALWKKPVFRLGVICIEYSDVKHNAKISAGDWEEELFSVGSYANKKNPTGQIVHGSLNEYFLEQSGFAFHFEGKIFDWVNVGKKRGDYIVGTGTSNKTVVLTDALTKLTAREGKDAFKNLDGFLFIYAGDSYKTNRGAVYYPHAGAVTFNETRFPYFLTQEGGSTMASVGGLTKIASQLLGLPDLAARPENAGSKGLGVWCALSNPILDGRPQHLSAWAKEKMGWIKPTVIDPTVQQKLLLSPIERSPKECFKIVIRPNGSEYYLIENRAKKGFDADLPGEGLLIWRVTKDRPVLCESHGIDGPKAPQIQLSAVPFPSTFNNAFTPDTTPSSRSPLGGGLPVHITQIQRLPDGRVAFTIGYEYR